MRKAGIITFHRADNFGAVLQNYALQTAIKKLYIYPETIDYRCPRVEDVYKPVSGFLTRHPMKMLREKYWEFKNLRASIESRNAFCRFRKDYLNISEKSYNSKNIGNADYDLYIVGSDQVWNNTIIDKQDYPAFTLSFTDKKKIAYGASCGSNKCMIDAIEEISRINHITVRETELANLLSQNGIGASLVCDPVFLLEGDEWRNVVRDILPYPRKYVYLYYVESSKRETAEIAAYMAEELNDLVLFSKKVDAESEREYYGVSMFSDGPLDFISRILHADYVVVSSFHGVAFSLLLEKEFAVVLHKQTGDRVRTLLEKCNLENRIVENMDDFNEKRKSWTAINYDVIRKTIAQWRSESTSVLGELCLGD